MHVRTRECPVMHGHGKWALCIHARYAHPARPVRPTPPPTHPGGAAAEAMSCAMPSTSAVLPTPGSPTSTGLFLVRRSRICRPGQEVGVDSEGGSRGAFGLTTRPHLAESRKAMQPRCQRFAPLRSQVAEVQAAKRLAASQAPHDTFPRRAHLQCPRDDVLPPNDGVQQPPPGLLRQVTTKALQRRTRHTPPGCARGRGAVRDVRACASVRKRAGSAGGYSMCGGR